MSLLLQSSPGYATILWEQRELPGGAILRKGGGMSRFAGRCTMGLVLGGAVLAGGALSVDVSAAGASTSPSTSPGPVVPTSKIVANGPHDAQFKPTSLTVQQDPAQTCTDSYASLHITNKWKKAAYLWYSENGTDNFLVRIHRGETVNPCFYSSATDPTTFQVTFYLENKSGTSTYGGSQLVVTAEPAEPPT